MFSLFYGTRTLTANDFYSVEDFYQFAHYLPVHLPKGSAIIETGYTLFGVPKVRIRYRRGSGVNEAITMNILSFYRNPPFEE